MLDFNKTPCFLDENRTCVKGSLVIETSDVYQLWEDSRQL